MCNQSILLWCELGHTTSPGQKPKGNLSGICTCNATVYSQYGFEIKTKDLQKITKVPNSADLRNYSAIYCLAWFIKNMGSMQSYRCYCFHSASHQHEWAQLASHLLQCMAPSLSASHTNVSSVYLVLPQTLAFSTQQTFQYVSTYFNCFDLASPLTSAIRNNMEQLSSLQSHVVKCFHMFRLFVQKSTSCQISTSCFFSA